MEIQRFMKIVLSVFAMIIFIGGVLPMTAISETQSGSVLDEKLDIYRDSEHRFEFSYPVNFGIPRKGYRDDMPGGDLGEEIFFPQFSYGLHNGEIVNGGVLVVRSGRVWVGVQALGGLYDSVLVGGVIDEFSLALRKKIFDQAENLTISNFCNELCKAEHITINDPALVGLSDERKQATIELDRTRNLNPKVITCKVLGDIVVFDKQILTQSGKYGNIQHIYGAIRFMKGPFTSVQFIRITHEPPSEKLLETMTKVVQSFKLL